MKYDFPVVSLRFTTKEQISKFGFGVATILHLTKTLSKPGHLLYTVVIIAPYFVIFDSDRLSRDAASISA
jgi:hypothetical protein